MISYIATVGLLEHISICHYSIEYGSLEITDFFIRLDSRRISRGIRMSMYYVLHFIKRDKVYCMSTSEKNIAQCLQY